ncbi:MAG: hypothetical protein KIH64_005055 [Mycobacterium sp.]|nr:hypothetical protein [Mycobacterium sp.]
MKVVGINIAPDRPGQRFRIGNADVEVVGVVAPCRLLDDVKP